MTKIRIKNFCWNWNWNRKKNWHRAIIFSIKKKHNFKQWNSNIIIGIINNFLRPKATKILSRLIHQKKLNIPTTISVNSNPCFTDFR